MRSENNRYKMDNAYRFNSDAYRRLDEIRLKYDSDE